MQKQSKADFKVFWRLIKFVKPHRKYLFFAFTCTILISLLTPARPFLIGKMVNQFIIDEQNQSALLKWTIVLFFMLILEGLFQFLLKTLELSYFNMS